MTPYEQASLFLGQAELGRGQDNPWIQAWFTLCGYGPDTDDETPWCSAFVNGIAFLQGLPRSGSAAARSWLLVGRQVNLTVAQQGDVVILSRGEGIQPGPNVIAAPGHVGFLSAVEPGHVVLLGGNQGNKVSLQRFSTQRLLGVRRLEAA